MDAETVRVELLAAEIGSTTTVVNAFSIDPPEFLAQGAAPTSVLDGDVRVGLRRAIEDCAADLARGSGVAPAAQGGGSAATAEEAFDALPLSWDRFVATSSAAGGLRMTVHGLVYDMTVRAAREAALGAGANLLQVTAGRMRADDIDEMIRIRPNIVLIAGGVDYGERDTALDNAAAIAAALKTHGLNPPVLYAGNVENRREVQRLCKSAGIEVTCVENVYPRIDELNAGPCRREIQRLFELHITAAPGMQGVRELVNDRVLPTPGAVMEAAEVLREEVGDLLVFDVGGATTDVHSVTDGSPEVSAMLVAPEPTAKRTVEGDLGVFANRANLVELAGIETLSTRLGIESERTRELVAGTAELPEGELQVRFIEELTRVALDHSFQRHVGRIRYLYGPSGRKQVAEGRDLTAVRRIVGTGGALTRLPHGGELMQRALPDFADRAPDMLAPARDAPVLLDRRYIMASIGAFSAGYPEAARALLARIGESRGR